MFDAVFISKEEFEQLEEFHTCLISNNKEPRVTPFAEALLLVEVIIMVIFI